MIDPFANAVENTAPVEPELPNMDPSPEAPPAPVEGVKPVLTFKGGAGYDSAWVVLHCDSTEAALAATHDPGLKSLLDRVQLIGKSFAGTGAASVAPSRPAASQGSQGATPQRPNPPGVPSIDCDHGPRNYVAKANWAALFCGSPQGTPDHEKCQPLWRDKFGNYKAR